MEISLVSGKIVLQKYEIQKTRIQIQIPEYQSKLEDKAGEFQEKEQEQNKSMASRLEKLIRQMILLPKVCQNWDKKVYRFFSFVRSFLKT